MPHNYSERSKKARDTNYEKGGKDYYKTIGKKGGEGGTVESRSRRGWGTHRGLAKKYALINAQARITKQQEEL